MERASSIRSAFDSVKLYRAAQAEKVSFRQLHTATGARVRHWRCVDPGSALPAPVSNEAASQTALKKPKADSATAMPAHDSDAGLQTAALKREDLMKGYEYEKGRYIRLSREELADVVPSTAREIDIREFVQPGEVDVVLVEGTFFVLPGWGSERAYGVLCKALGRSGLVGVSDFDTLNWALPHFLCRA